jgi:hypothetical protein
MTRVDFDERAAILEYDGGLSRVTAESQALREICDLKLAAGYPGILGELAQADRRRAHPDIAPVLAELGLANVRGPAWGLGHVVADGETYRPALDDEPAHAAFIVPAVEAGAISDLVACTVTGRRMTSRLGVAALIGLEEIERARDTDAPLLMFDDVVRWLRGNTCGAVIVDRRRAAPQLEGVRTMVCSLAFAPRLYQATRRCLPRPIVATPAASERRRAA